MKNAPTPKLPDGFFENNTQNNSSVELDPKPPSEEVGATEKGEPEAMEEDIVDIKDPLPEGFFDDPVKDAKVFLKASIVF